MIKLHHEPVFIILCGILYKELYGHSASKSYLYYLAKHNTMSLFERLRIDYKTSITKPELSPFIDLPSQRERSEEKAK
jgi:hypothetical protein